METTKQRVEHVVEDRGAHDDTKSVEVANNIVWHAVRRQHGRQKACRVTQPVVIDELDWEEAKDSCRLECAADVFNKLVVPMSREALALGCDY